MESDTLKVYNDPEIQHLNGKLINILNNRDKEHKGTITNIINILCGDKMWIKEGRWDRRKKLVPLHGNQELRIKNTYS